MSKTHIYKVVFHNQNTIYEIYAKNVDQGSVFGFVELSHLVFGSTSELLVDPSEERLKTEFSGVKKTYIPIHSIIRIDEVEKEGVAKIREVSGKNGSNITDFPTPIYTPTDPSKKS